MNILPTNYIQTLRLLKDKINQARYQSLRAVNTEMILAYIEIGKVLSEQVKKGWGSSVIDRLSQDLRAEYIGMRGFSPRNLRNMKFIYEQTSQSVIWQQAVAKLPWGHSNLIFSKIKTPEARDYYLSKSDEQGWSRSVLAEKIRFDSYKKAINFQNNFENTIDKKELVEYRLEFSDEYNLSFLGLGDTHTEQQLENSIVKNISKTLGQLGNDFAFMGQQFRLELDDKEYFVDLLFYHRKLKAMIAIELKIKEFKPEYSQQLNWYLHLLDKTVKYSDDNPSIGILLCKSKSKLTVEYALELVNKPIGVATYTYSQLPDEIAKNLPNEQEFRNLLNYGGINKNE
jgi:predicted nuclease of restriction endonuclease-like (RecB) superfamily